jgi:hypothetical protein
MKISAIFILVCSFAYAADEKTSPTPAAPPGLVRVATKIGTDYDLPNRRGHIHSEEFYRGNMQARIMRFYQKTVAGQTTTTGRIFFLGDVTVYETEDAGDKGFRSVILFNDKTKQVEGFIEKRDGTAVPFDAEIFAELFDAKTLAGTKEQIDAVVRFWGETHGKEFLEVAKALQEKLRHSDKKKAQDER